MMRSSNKSWDSVLSYRNGVFHDWFQQASDGGVCVQSITCIEAALSSLLRVAFGRLYRMRRCILCLILTAVSTSATVEVIHVILMKDIWTFFPDLL